jgi:cellulose synthase/poly-beta-1,6-N-acetylglucosamine synthase-like glycosyltransferase
MSSEVRGGAAVASGYKAAVAVLIPAHNEAAGIEDTLRSAALQSRPPGRVCVIADNCTDDTARLAREAGAEVVETVGNTEKKAGALNQFLERWLPLMADEDMIVVQDADTQLSPEFIETAARELENGAGACGGVFYGAPGSGLLGQLQRQEYARYARQLGRNRGKARVLTGTGTAFRAGALKHLLSARRSGQLPGGTGVYTISSLTEDGEITLALKTLGYKCVSPEECWVTTEIMPTLPKLWRQRTRWQRGALEDLRSYGLTRVTSPYIFRQFVMGLSVAVFLLWWVSAPGIIAEYGIHFSWLWTGISVLFVIERVVTVRRAGWKAMLLAFLMLPELIYDLFQHAVWMASVAAMAVRTKTTEW